jgi:hypothetical protein
MDRIVPAPYPEEPVEPRRVQENDEEETTESEPADNDLDEEGVPLP